MTNDNESYWFIAFYKAFFAQFLFVLKLKLKSKNICSKNSVAFDSKYKIPLVVFIIHLVMKCKNYNKNRSVFTSRHMQFNS